MSLKPLYLKQYLKPLFLKEQIYLKSVNPSFLNTIALKQAFFGIKLLVKMTNIKKR